MDKTRYVIIVDDESLSRYSLGITISNYDLTMIEAKTGNEGLQKILDSRKEEKEIAFIILDMMLPGMSGLELLDNLELFNINIPVIAISGYLSSDIVEKLHQKHIYHIIPKPFRPEEIHIYIREILGNAVSS